MVFFTSMFTHKQSEQHRMVAFGLYMGALCLFLLEVALGRVQDIAHTAEFLTRILCCLINVLLSYSTCSLFLPHLPSSLCEMTLRRRVSIPAAPLGLPRASLLSLAHQTDCPLSLFPASPAPFFPSFSSFITCYPRVLDPLRFVPEAQWCVLSHLSSHFLCLPEHLGENY